MIKIWYWYILALLLKDYFTFLVQFYIRVDKVNGKLCLNGQETHTRNPLTFFHPTRDIFGTMWNVKCARVREREKERHLPEARVREWKSKNACIREREIVWVWVSERERKWMVHPSWSYDKYQIGLCGSH